MIDRASSLAAIDEVLETRGGAVNHYSKSMEKMVTETVEKSATTLSDKDIKRIQIYLEENNLYKDATPDKVRAAIKECAILLKAMREADLFKVIGL